MPSEPAPESSKAGITLDNEGNRIIPSSVRADGTLRKAIKVRPGYKPPEDVEVYKNRTSEAWKNRGKGGVPGAEPIDSDKAKDGAAGKNAKRREARKKAAAENKDEPPAKKEVKKVEEEVVDPEVEKQKEAKKLVKKLRQAKELKDKKEQGAALLPEQFEKVIRINELIRQLDSLGFDLEGEKKDQKKDEVDGGKEKADTNT
jgi:partner of Y14 and mago protein